MIPHALKKLLHLERSSRLPAVPEGRVALVPFSPSGGAIVDYSTADLFESERPTRRRGPAWLARLLAPREPAVMYQPLVPRRAARPAMYAAGSRELSLYRPELQGWGAAAPSYVRWQQSCRGACEPVTLGGPPRRPNLLRFFVPGDAIMPATIDAWSDRAWPVALRIEEAVHLKPLYLPERYQVGFCCGSPELASELILLILADNVDAHLAIAHDEDDQHLPCDILLPVRPGATQEELDDVVAASVRAVHTILGARHAHTAS